MSAPVAASLYESLAGAYWAVANHEREIADRFRKAGAKQLAKTYENRSARAERRARDAEEYARHLWETAA